MPNQILEEFTDEDGMRVFQKLGILNLESNLKHMAGRFTRTGRPFVDMPLPKTFAIFYLVESKQKNLWNLQETPSCRFWYIA